MLMKIPEISKLKNPLSKSCSMIGKDEYFNAAVLVPIITIKDSYHLLFQKRAVNIRQGGEICFPGGEFDKKSDKNIIDTALRETSEELGIPASKISVIGEMNFHVAPFGITVDPVLAFLDISIEEIKIDKNEVESIFTVPLEYFIKNEPEVYYSRTLIEPYYFDETGKKIELLPVEKLGLPSIYGEPREGRKFKVYVFNFNGYKIWGITAVIIKELIRIIKAEI